MKILIWYNNEGSAIKETKDPGLFEIVALTQTAQPDRFYGRQGH